MKLQKIAFALAAVFLVVASAQGQGRKPLPPDEQSQYVVSAKAGIVNVVEGEVSFERAGKTDLLLTGDTLRAGDKVKTGSDGRVEILLNPGSYLRLASNSEFAFSDTRLNNIELNLFGGSAIVEASVIMETITVFTPQGEVPLTNGGLYRFNVGTDKSSEIVLRKGKVLAGGVVIKEGKKAMLGAGAPAITPFDKKVEDDFDLWSKERARIIVAANKKLSNRALTRSGSLSLSGNAWIFNPFMGSYTFLPGYWGVVSPYGYGYNSCNPYYRRPDWNPGTGGSTGGYNGGTGSGGSGSNGGTSRGNGAGSGGSGGTIGREPPPQRGAPPPSSRGRNRDY